MSNVVAGTKISWLAAMLGAAVGAMVFFTCRKGAARARPFGCARKSVKVSAAVERVYLFWRDLRNLPFLFERLDSVEVLGAARSRWRASGPLGATLEWEVRIVDERENELLSWTSVEGSEIATRGTVHFRPTSNGRGTEISVEVEYAPPARMHGRTTGLLSTETLGVEIEHGLRRLKRIMETGETVHADAGSYQKSTTA